jgi:hypothetical protein
MTLINQKNINRYIRAFMPNVSVLFLCLFVLTAFQQSESDESIYNRKIQNAQGASLDDFTLNIAKSFLNRPYKTKILEVNSSESS